MFKTNKYSKNLVRHRSQHNPNIPERYPIFKRFSHRSKTEKLSS